VPNFGIVYSGKKVSQAELDRLIALTERIKTELGMGVCMSLGIVSEENMQRLADAGVVRFNHNLETSERHFSEVVSTHKYADRVKTIEAGLRAGMGVCAGGIFGIGETEADRIDMALELRRLGVDMVPMNFLHPIEGTPLGKAETMPPREILRIVALYRFPESSRYAKLDFLCRLHSDPIRQLPNHRRKICRRRSPNAQRLRT
jgi:biotin synthase